jgi:hypothetical protein
VVPALSTASASKRLSTTVNGPSRQKLEDVKVSELALGGRSCSSATHVSQSSRVSYLRKVFDMVMGAGNAFLRKRYDGHCVVVGCVVRAKG